MVKTILRTNKEEIVKLYTDGVSTCEIGRRFNISNASVYVFLRDECGVKIRKTKQNDRFDDVVKLFNQGVSIYQIAKDLNIGQTTVHRYCKKAGLDTSKNSKIREDQLINHKDEIIKEYKSGIGCTKLSQKYNCVETSIIRLIRNAGEECGLYKRDYHFNERFFENIDTQEKAYVAGFIQGDGYNNGNGLVITICDEELIYKIRSAMNIEMIPIKYIKPRKSTHQPQFALKVCSTLMSKDLDRLGLIRNKTFYTYLPKEDQVPKDLLRHFLRGLFDADGSITNGAINYVGYKQLMFDIADLLKNMFGFNIWCNNNSKTCHKDIYKLVIRKYESQIKFLDYIYQDATIFLKRKYDRYLELKNAGKSICFSNSL